MNTVIKQSIEKSELNILETFKTGTIKLDTDNYQLFGFENKPWSLVAVPALCGHTKKKCYEIKSTHRHTFSPSQPNVLTTKMVEILP